MSTVQIYILKPAIVWQWLTENINSKQTLENALSWDKINLWYLFPRVIMETGAENHILCSISHGNMAREAAKNILGGIKLGGQEVLDHKFQRVAWNIVFN